MGSGAWPPCPSPSSSLAFAVRPEGSPCSPESQAYLLKNEYNYKHHVELLGRLEKMYAKYSENSK